MEGIWLGVKEEEEKKQIAGLCNPIPNKEMNRL
jgi:hypothetical protein